MTPEQRAAARARCEAATAEPWVVEGGGGMHMDGTRDWYSIDCQWKEADKYRITLMVRKQNADFIAHARTDLPAALDEIDRLEEECERLRGDRRDAFRALVYACHSGGMALSEYVPACLLDDAMERERRVAAALEGVEL